MSIRAFWRDCHDELMPTHNEHAELKRLSSGSCTARHFINSGEHWRICSRYRSAIRHLSFSFPEIHAFGVAQPKGGGSILNELKRATWKTRGAGFSKVDHARALLTLIKAKTKVPRQAREWIKAACEIAKKTGSLILDRHHTCPSTQDRESSLTAGRTRSLHRLDAEGGRGFESCISRWPGGRTKHGADAQGARHMLSVSRPKIIYRSATAPQTHRGRG